MFHVHVFYDSCSAYLCKIDDRNIRFKNKSHYLDFTENTVFRLKYLTPAYRTANLIETKIYL